jgi:hypothetical protein
MLPQQVRLGAATVGRRSRRLVGRPRFLRGRGTLSKAIFVAIHARRRRSVLSTRVNPFATLNDPPPAFTTKPKAEKPVQQETIERIAAQNNSPSRQAPKSAKVDRPKPRVYRTGRNQQFNAKATPETIRRFYKVADDKRVKLGELLKRRVDALDAVDSLQKLADKRDIPLGDLVKQALDALEREGVSRQHPETDVSAVNRTGQRSRISLIEIA